jgi:oligopeptide/dipeptide ABC transporter ATP-binding protein
MSDPLLSVRDLTVHLRAAHGDVRAVEEVSFDVGAGEHVAIIGESGSGKSVTALSVLQLHDRRRVRYGSASSIRFRGEELLGAPAERIRRLRGHEIAMVFQDPMAALNPVFTVGDQLGHVVRTRLGKSRTEARDRTVQMLREVEIKRPEDQIHRFPHELSGGMRQRVLIAMALLCEPSILIADEPTSALDVTVQASVLETMRALAERHAASVVLITHDMGVVARYSDFVHVMYGGVVVEHGTVDALFARPRHPYTAALLRCTPRIDGDREHRLVPIGGTQEVRLGSRPEVGCPFAGRCRYVEERCRTSTPELRSPPDDDARGAVACHRAEALDLTNEMEQIDETIRADG